MCVSASVYVVTRECSFILRDRIKCRKNVRFLIICMALLQSLGLPTAHTHSHTYTSKEHIQNNSENHNFFAQAESQSKEKGFIDGVGEKMRDTETVIIIILATQSGLK